MMSPIAMPATGALIGTPASIIAIEPPQTDAIDDEPLDSRMSDTMRIGVGELLFAGDDRRERALGQRAVADLAAAGTGEAAGLADRERREVVVQHEALVELAADVLDLLLVVGGAERAGDERLRLAAREHDRAVHAGQHAGLGPDRTDLVELAAVEPMPLLSTSSRNTFSCISWKMCFASACCFSRRAPRADPRGPCRPGCSFRACSESASRRRAVRTTCRGRSAWNCWSTSLAVTASFCLPERLLELVDGGDELLDRRMRGFERADHLLFGHFLRARFDHQDAIGAAGDDAGRSVLSLRSA